MNPLLTVEIVLVLAAFIAAVLSFIPPSRVPLGVAVLILCIIALIHVLPMGAK